MGTRDERDGMEAAHRSSNLFHFAAQTPLSGITANGIFYIEHSLTQQHRRSAKGASYAPRGLLTHYHTTDKLNLVLIFIELLVHNVTPIREALPPPPKKKKGGVRWSKTFIDHFLWHILPLFCQKKSENSQ